MQIELFWKVEKLAKLYRVMLILINYRTLYFYKPYHLNLL
jgi:hypothetical protein